MRVVGPSAASLFPCNDNTKKQNYYERDDGQDADQNYDTWFHENMPPNLRYKYPGWRTVFNVHSKLLSIENYKILRTPYSAV